MPPVGRTRRRLCLMLLPLLAFGALILLSLQINSGSFIEIDAKISNGQRVEAFWISGDEDFSQTLSSSIPIRSARRGVYRLPLSTILLRAARLDLSDSSFNATIYRISIKTPLFTQEWGGERSFTNWEPLYNIENFGESRGRLRVSTSSTDGSIVVRLERATLAWQVVRLCLYFLPLGLVIMLRAAIGRAWEEMGSSAGNLPIVSGISRALNRLAEQFSESGHIRFSGSSIAIVLLACCLFVVSVALRLQCSSVGMWDSYLPHSGDSSTLLGHPRQVRSDEWLVGTPFILSQLNHQPVLPLANGAVGAGESPVLLGLPSAHPSNIFRPQNWGFYLFSIEHAYAWWWNIKVLGCFLGFFLLLLLLTSGATWLSLCGSLWFLYSGFTQWWFSANMPDIAASFLWGVLALCYLWGSARPVRIAIAAIVCSISSIDFVMALYPPFQVPLAYLALVMVMCLLVQGRFSSSYGLLKITMTVGALAVVAVVVGSLYLDTKATIQIMQQTVYPGERLELGGGYGLLRYFSGFFDLFLKETVFPAGFGNICEGSSFILLWPVVGVTVLCSLARGRGQSILYIGLLAYLTLVTYFMVQPIPAWLAKLTLFSLVPTPRALLAIGIANIVVVIVWLSEQVKREGRLVSVASILIAACSILFCIRFSAWAQGYFPIWNSALICMLMVTLGWLLYYGKKGEFGYLILLLTVVPNLLVNPISQGLGSITQTELFKTVNRIVKSDPSGRWVVVGDFVIPGVVKAAGASVMSGAQFAPDMKGYRVLDPEGKYANVYNRYAHVIVDNNAADDQISFSLVQGDLFRVTVPLCSPALAELNVRYFIVPGGLPADGSECLKPLQNKPIGGGLWLYEREP